MKLITPIVFCILASLGQAQILTSGLIPKTPTFYVNTNYFNNASGESPGIDIAANGNVIIGWEDDGADIADFESAFSVFNNNGVLITPQTVVTSYQFTTTITNTFRSYYRSDGTVTPAYTGFGPKIKANRFGNGIGHGSSDGDIGLEVPELGPINLDADGGNSFAAVQTMDNAGNPTGLGPFNGILTGGTDADLEPSGGMRIGDWDYLSSGNIVIVNESRQVDDLVNRFAGAASGRHITYRIVTPANADVKSYSLVSEGPTTGEMWHGVGVTANGFAVRWNKTSGATPGVTVRLFDNAGTPITGDLNLATVAGHPEAGGGGRGDSTGFHGNGKDAYLHVCGSASGPWITVLNADGTLRYSRAVADPSDPIVNSGDRVDGAIAPDGRVIAIWNSPLQNALSTDVTNRTIQARLFAANGDPIGGRFVVSDWEVPSNPATTNASDVPRIGWRNDTIAMVWLSANAPTFLIDPIASGDPGARVVAAKLFTVSALPVLSIAKTASGVTVSWTGSGILQSATSLNGPWSDVGDLSPIALGSGGSQKFFRVRTL